MEENVASDAVTYKVAQSQTECEEEKTAMCRVAQTQTGESNVVYTLSTVAPFEKEATNVNDARSYRVAQTQTNDDDDVVVVSSDEEEDFIITDGSESDDEDNDDGRDDDGR